MTGSSISDELTRVRPAWRDMQATQKVPAARKISPAGHYLFMAGALAKRADQDEKAPAPALLPLYRRANCQGPERLFKLQPGDI
jgi:hypothetical protein